MRARGCGLRSVAPHSIRSAQRSDEYANSPLTFGIPSGRRTDSPTPNGTLTTWVVGEVIAGPRGWPAQPRCRAAESPRVSGSGEEAACDRELACDRLHVAGPQ